MFKKVPITCPVCQMPSTFKAATSLDTIDNPEMRDFVLSGKAFTFTCPDCGETLNFDHEMLYHQAEDKFMIQYVMTDNRVEYFSHFLGDGGIVGNLREIGYRFRIVRSQQALLEKIRILSDGLDDRAIELCKAEMDPEGHREMYYARDEGDIILDVFENGEKSGQRIVLREKYEDRARQTAGMKDELFVDGQWAREVAPVEK